MARNAYVVSISCCTRGGMIVKKIKLSYLFKNFYLFDIIFYFIYQWYLKIKIITKIHLWPRCTSDFAIDCFWNCLELEERETKKHYFVFTILFSNFSNFWKFKYRFKYQVKQTCLNSDQFFQSCIFFFVKNAMHYKTDLKHAAKMPSLQRYCVICIYRCIKFYCSTMRQSWVP